MNRLIEDHGVVLSLPNSSISNFPSSVEVSSDGVFTLYYSRIQYDGDSVKFAVGRSIGVLGNMKQTEFSVTSQYVQPGKEKSPIIGNLPDGWMPTQVIHHQLPNGDHRIWFWTHSPAEGIVRFLAADSVDNIVYNVVNPHKPCLWHYADRAVEDKLPELGGLVYNSHWGERPEYEPAALPELVCNDATTLYLLPDGTFEIYSAVLCSCPEGSPEYIPWDNAPGKRRYIKRWISKDGLNFTPTGTVLTFDSDDPPYLQFYYLAIRHCTNNKRQGFIGRYNVLEQTMDIEFCTSEDGVNFQRSAREPFFKRSPLELGLYTSNNPLVRYDNRDYCFYSSTNGLHNHKYCTGDVCTMEVRCISFPAVDL